MKQPIAGVVPSHVAEGTVAVAWPSISAYASGQRLGRLYGLRWPDRYIFRSGNLLALLSIPYALFLYFCRVAPKSGIRYRLTNRRIVIERGLRWIEERAIEMGGFDEIRIDVKPGQEWFHAGDLVMMNAGKEAFRLEGVSRPEPFRQLCLKTQTAHLSVRKVLEQQPAPVHA